MNEASRFLVLQRSTRYTRTYDDLTEAVVKADELREGPGTERVDVYVLVEGDPRNE